MVVAEVLDAVGVEGGLVLVVSALLGVYHLRHGLAFFSQIATWVQALAVMGVLTVAAGVGLIPGVSVQVALGQLASAFWGVVDVLGGVVGVVAW